MDYSTLKLIHILSATLLFGTGLGSAFYKWMADRSKNLQAMAHTNEIVVMADWLFTTPTVIIQPVTGIWLLHMLGIPFSQPWVVAVFVLYFVAGACWLPVVWLQIKMRDMSQYAVQQGSGVGDQYHRYAHFWFWLGVPAFISMVAVYFLMVFKPVINF